MHAIPTTDRTVLDEAKTPCLEKNAEMGIVVAKYARAMFHLGDLDARVGNAPEQRANLQVRVSRFHIVI